MHVSNLAISVFRHSGKVTSYLLAAFLLRILRVTGDLDLSEENMVRKIFEISIFRRLINFFLRIFVYCSIRRVFLLLFIGFERWCMRCK